MSDQALPPDVPPTEPGDLEDALFVEPPRWPKVVGITSIVWASLWLTCSGVGVLAMIVFMPMMQSAAQQQSPGASLPPTMQMDPMKWASMAFSLILLVVLLIAGIMLVNRRPAARALHLLYGVLGLVGAAWGMFMQWQAHTQMAQWRQANPTSPFAQQSSAVGEIIGLIIGLVAGLGWPVFCLIWFGLVKRTHESMTGGIDEPAA